MMRMWLKNLRDKKGATQKQVASEVDISRQAYNLIENGVRRPSPKVAKRLGELFGFDWTRFYEDATDPDTRAS